MLGVEAREANKDLNAVVVPGFYAALCAAENPEEFLSIIETSNNDTMDYTGSKNLLRLLVIINKLSPDLRDAINEKATGFLEKRVQQDRLEPDNNIKQRYGGLYRRYRQSSPPSRD